MSVGLRQRTSSSRFRLLASALLVILLALPGFVSPSTALARNLDYIIQGDPGGVVIEGIWSRSAFDANRGIMAEYGMNRNFVWYSDVVTIQGTDTRRWAGRYPTSWAQYQKIGTYWFAQVWDTLAYPYSDTFTAYSYGTSFVARVCGNFTPSFSNPSPPRISGYKWNDLNGNGAWDGGEPAVSGWKINFFRNGTSMGSATTKGSGYYEFVIDANTGRLPGTWTMTEDIKQDWYQTRAPGAVAVVEGSYSAGRNYGNNNFGNFRYGTISGAKWNDVDADGQRDGDEPGLGNWMIRLRKGGIISKEASTATNGAYSFVDLPAGTYTVEEVQQAGWRQTAPTASTYSVTVTSGGLYPGRDFGNLQDGSITPYKVHDLDMDGTWDQPDEPLLPGWVMHLGPGVFEPTATTGSLATTPKWEQLPAGTYRVWEELQPHFAPTAEPTRTVVLGAGQHITVPFFNVHLGGIVVTKYHDLDGDGSKGANEPAIPGWGVVLSKDGVSVATSETDSAGEVYFDDLLPGDYTVTEESRPPYWVSTTSESSDIILGPGQQVDVFFGNRLLGDIEGHKFEDMNGNHAFDAGEPPVAGVSVALAGTNGVAVGLPTTTDANGRYRFSGIVPGDYVVAETVPDGWMASSTTTGSVTVAGGRVNDGPDFLNVEGVTISGTKFDDSNADGARSGDETGLAGWEIILDRKVGDGWSEEATAATEADGSFHFDMLWPGEYRVHEVMQPHWKQTVAPEPTSFLSSGDDSPNRDFGNIQLAELTLTKWDDSNSNGVRDEGEQAIPGWEFDVKGIDVAGNTFSRTATTSAEGVIVLSDLMPGEYSAAEQRVGRVLNPNGSVAEPGWRPTTSDVATVTLGEGEAKSTSFGNIHLGWIWGRVTHEVYHNGIGGIKIDLEETNETCYTNADGYYFFYDVEPNETSACPTPDYLVGMDLAGTNWKTRGAVDKSVVVPEGGVDRADFTVYEDTHGNQPRTIGYWKNWDNHFTRAEMQVLVDKVRAGSTQFANLTLDDIYPILQVDKKSSMRAKARTQYLAFWLNVASGNLGFSTNVNVGSVSGWQQVVTSATADGVTTVIDLIKDAEDAFTHTWVPSVWETIKNIFDQLNNGLLT